MQVDIGFGDVITPAASFADFSSLIGLPPHVRVYPRETVVAKKYEAMVRLGAINSRVKDFYDLWAIAHEYTFTGTTLAEAIRATFKRRDTILPEAAPIALTSAFTNDLAKRQLWQAFINRNKLESTALPLTETMTLPREFLLPPTLSLVANCSFDQHWTPGGPWQPQM